MAGHLSGIDPLNFQEMASGHIDGLMQKRRNSIANKQEIRVFCIKTSIYCLNIHCSKNIDGVTLQESKAILANIKIVLKA